MTSVAVFEATVRASEAGVETARINLNFTTIRAPITGRTGSVALKQGNVVKAVDTLPTVMPMVSITQFRPIYVTFTVPEKASRRSSRRCGILSPASCRDYSQLTAKSDSMATDIHRQSGPFCDRHDLP